MPLANQQLSNSNITVTVPLQGLGPGPSFIPGGTTFNSGNPNATFTIPTRTSQSGVTGRGDDLLDLLERLWREGSATVS